MDDAIRELEIAARPAHGHNSRIEAYLGYAYAAAGRTLDARAVLKELDAHRRDQYVSAFGIALIHDALGEGELAVASRGARPRRPCRRIRHDGTVSGLQDDRIRAAIPGCDAAGGAPASKASRAGTHAEGQPPFRA